MMTIAIGHRPPHGKLRIVRAGGYTLAVLPGENVGEMVREAENVLYEMLACPWLGEPDSVEMEEYNVSVSFS